MFDLEFVFCFGLIVIALLAVVALIEWARGSDGLVGVSIVVLFVAWLLIFVPFLLVGEQI